MNKRTIFDCWKCKHHDSNNPYGLDYCNVQDTRCSFVCENCENFEPEKGEDHHEQQEQEEQEPPKGMGLIGCYLMFVLAALLGWLLTGCTTTKFVPVVEYHTDTLLWHSNTHDSIYVHDSIHVREKGDTVTIERWHTRWRDRWHSDTVYISKTDSVPQAYPVEVVKEVAKPLTWWQQARMYVGGFVIFGVIVFAAWKIYVALHPRL